MMEEVGNFPHNLANSSPTYYDNLLYISTGNGQDESHVNIPSPKAPAIIALDLHDRQAGVGRRVAGRQDPARPVVHAVGRHDRRRRAGRARPGRRLGARLRGEDRQEALGVRHESEGLRVAEDAQRGHRHAGDLRQRRLHRERPGSRARRGRRPPLCDRRHQARRHHADRAHLALRRDDPPLDLRRRRSRTASSTSRTSAGSCTRSTSRPASRSGSTTCSPPCGARRWWRTARSIWATRTATSSSCRQGREKKMLAENTMDSSVYSTVVTANGVMFIMTRNKLYAIQEGAQKKVAGDAARSQVRRAKTNSDHAVDVARSLAESRRSAAGRQPPTGRNSATRLR